MALASLARFPMFQNLFADYENLLRDTGFTRPLEASGALVPVADVAETAKSIEIHMDMPGFKGDQIDVKMEGDVLTVSAERTAEKDEQGKNWVRTERSWGKYLRSFTLPSTVSGSTPEAHYKNGVLEISLAKKPEVQPKAVKVKVDD